MKTRYVAAVAMLVLLVLVEPSSAQFSSFWTGPGDMRVEGELRGKPAGVIFRYDFTFRLAEDSDGIYPAAEVVEIEVPGELNPDGSESSAFAISIPIGSFREGPSGFFYTWNPPGLKVSQHYESYVWDFVDSEGVRRESSGVMSFWAFIHKRSGGQINNLSIRMFIRDNRYDIDAAEPAPKFLELLLGGPTLKIGNDGWETQVQYLESTAHARCTSGQGCPGRKIRAIPYSPPG